jgi:peptidoglycan/LPS O-acetylase OafA/YrhL
MLVLHFHAFPQVIPGGFIGVDVFFVISGFLITGIIARELDQKRFSLPHFYVRRIRRISRR